jgi:hypothetical protein
MTSASSALVRLTPLPNSREVNDWSRRPAVQTQLDRCGILRAQVKSPQMGRRESERQN